MRVLRRTRTNLLLAFVGSLVQSHVDLQTRRPGGSEQNLAQQFIDAVLDEGSFVSWDESPIDVHPDDTYRANSSVPLRGPGSTSRYSPESAPSTDAGSR